MNNNFSVSGYGLALDGKELYAFLEKVYEAFDEDDKECTDPNSTDEMMETIRNNYSGKYIIHDVYYYADVEMPSFYPISENDVGLDCDYLFFFSEKQPKIIGVAYNRKEELIQEFKDDLGQFLPDDFNWEDHIGGMSGVLYG